MKTLKKFYGFVNFLVLCYVLNKVKTAPHPSLPFDEFYYEKQKNPINFALNFSFSSDGIKSNIDKLYNESEVAVHHSEDNTDLNNEFKNGTYSTNEFVKNSTDLEMYQLSGDRLNHSQSSNKSNYQWDINNASGPKQSIVHKKGGGTDLNDAFKDSHLYKNVRLNTYDHNQEAIKIDTQQGLENVEKTVSSMGNMKYKAQNESEFENNETSAYFSKMKNVFRDDTAKLERQIQDSHFNQTKKLDQVNANRRNWESEHLLKTGSHNYEKDKAAGIESLKKRCLNQLRQEIVYKDPKTEIKYMKSYKNKKKSFFKKYNDRTPNAWLNFDAFLEDCQDVLANEKNVQAAAAAAANAHRVKEVPPVLNHSNIKPPDLGEDDQTNLGDQNLEKLEAFNESSSADLFNVPNPVPQPIEVPTPIIPGMTPAPAMELHTTELPQIVPEINPPAAEAPRVITDTNNIVQNDDYNKLKQRYDEIYQNLDKCDGCDGNGDSDCFEGNQYEFDHTKALNAFDLPVATRRGQTNLFPSKNMRNRIHSMRSGDFTKSAHGCDEGDDNCLKEYYDYYYDDENDVGDNDYHTTEALNNTEETTEVFSNNINEAQENGAETTPEQNQLSDESSRAESFVSEKEPSANDNKKILNLRRTVFGR